MAERIENPMINDWLDRDANIRPDANHSLDCTINTAKEILEE